MPTNYKQSFITQYQPYCHPSTKSLGLCSSVLSATEPISQYMVVARTSQQKKSRKKKFFTAFAKTETAYKESLWPKWHKK